MLDNPIWIIAKDIPSALKAAKEYWDLPNMGTMPSVQAVEHIPTRVYDYDD
jgi:hypothetical protein